MACDICSQNLTPGTGFILTTKQVVSSITYWHHVLELNPALGLEKGAGLRIFAMDMARQPTPWLVCDKCIDKFSVNRENAERLAKDFWEGREIPDYGPADLHDIQFPSFDVGVEGSSIDKPSKAYLIGNGFYPDQALLHFCMGAMLNAYPALRAEHLTMIPIEAERTPKTAMDVFMTIRDRLCEQHPGGHLIDIIRLDNSTLQRHCMFVLVWEGSAAVIAQKELPPRSDFMRGL